MHLQFRWNSERCELIYSWDDECIVWMLRGLYRSDIYHRPSECTCTVVGWIKRYFWDFLHDLTKQVLDRRSVNTTRFAELSTNTHFVDCSYFLGRNHFHVSHHTRKVSRAHKTAYLIWLFTSLGRQQFEYRVIFVITLWASACVHNRDVIFRSHVQQFSCHLSPRRKKDRRKTWII